MPWSPPMFVPGKPGGLRRNRESAWASRRHPGRKWYASARWKARREEQLMKEPICRMCRAAGLTTAANTADHVIPHLWNPRAFWEGELQSLCGPCHSAKTAKEGNGAFGN